MQGGFISAVEARSEAIPLGTLAWFSAPPDTGAKSLAVVEVRFSPDGGHDFHLHPGQEEVIYVLEGKIEQWVGRDRRLLVAGDSAFITAGTPHASFNVTESDARILAILGPCVGETGYELVDLAGQEPWASLR